LAIPEKFSFTRYLEAKKSVDDRALNSHVWQALANHLPASSREKPLRIIEAGAGIGTMIERMLEKNLLSYATYTAIDVDRENKAGALRRMRDWSASQGIGLSVGSGDRWKLTGAGKRIDVRYRNEDFFDFVGGNGGKWDLIVASAFLDIVDIPTALPLMLDLLDDEGLCYFSINFDGMTILEPAIDPELDRLIVNRYHRSMDERTVNGKPSGNSRTGRCLFSCLSACGARILAAGGSDWVVFAGPDGYPGDEAYFLHVIVHTMHEALKSNPALDSRRLGEWVAQRHRQIERGELVYIAHQLDFIGRKATAVVPGKASTGRLRPDRRVSPQR
jgi:hypothetical protein